jgi:hypothetical protein
MDTTTAFDEYLSVITKNQDAVIAAIRSWNEALHAIKLPKPEEFVATGYDFTAKLLASQRHFAEELLKVAAEPVPQQAKAKA